MAPCLPLRAPPHAALNSGRPRLSSDGRHLDDDRFRGHVLDVHDIEHVFFGWTRLFTALVMGGVMTA